MLPPTPEQKESITQLLLSPNTDNVQVALNLLESHPHWKAPLKEALEVFYFFDSRRYDGPIVFEFQTPIIEFWNQQGELRDAHQLVQEWLEELEEDFDGPLHPLFWLGSPGLLFQEKVEKGEDGLEVTEMVPSFALPELEFMEQQWTYSSYLDLHPEWWLVAVHWGHFILAHLKLQETTQPLDTATIEAYNNIAWQYYQKAFPVVKKEVAFFHQVADALQQHPPTSLSKEEREYWIITCYEKALALLEIGDSDKTLTKYIIFTYRELEDKEKILFLLKKAAQVLEGEEFEQLQEDCKEWVDAEEIRQWTTHFSLQKYFFLSDWLSKQLEGWRDELTDEDIEDIDIDDLFLDDLEEDLL